MYGHSTFKTKERSAPDNNWKYEKATFTAKKNPEKF